MQEMFCNKCFSKMDGPVRGRFGGQPQEVELFECHICVRQYDRLSGYQPIKPSYPLTLDPQWVCNSTALRPLYIAELLADGRLKVRCPDPNCRCEHEYVIGRDEPKRYFDLGIART